jgi:uncharacterized membrane protein YdjX (TVP38/TMEM64 family)
MRVSTIAGSLGVGLLLGWGVWSYVDGGIIRILVDPPAAASPIEALRDALSGAGALAPLVYVLAVVVEVLVAPLPGLLLYAPGGALFGGWWGGTLSLVGNVIGAALASWIGATVGRRWDPATRAPGLAVLADRVRSRGVLVVALLRVNPLTSSDLVSYAAGMVGVPVWRVALGTLVGMAPLAYAQSFASEWIFTWVPRPGLVVTALGVAYLFVVLWWLTRGRETRT